MSFLVTVVLAAGCGGGGTTVSKGTTLPPSGGATSTTASTVPETTVPASTSTTPTTLDPALAGKATAALFQAADLPLSFKKQNDQTGTCPDTNDPCQTLYLETVWHDITTCLGVDDTPLAKATSPTWAQGLATQARVTVEYTTESAVAAIEAAVAGPKYAGCLTPAFTTDAKRNAPSGATPSPVTIAPLPPPQVGDKVSSKRVNVTMNLGDPPLKIAIFQDFLIIFKGTAIIRFFFLNPGGPFAPNLEQSLIQKTVSRA